MRYILADAKTWFSLKGFVKENRKKPTFAEKLLWINLRNSQLGYKFRRQHAVSKYIVDLICIEKKLIIEIDGSSHNDKKEYDFERERELQSMGFDVIRFSNEEVIYSRKTVINKIMERLERL